MSFFNFEELNDIEENLNEAKTVKELTDDEEAKRRFRKYAGLDNNIKITPEDIKKNWNLAYMRVCVEMGYPKEALLYVLLDKEPENDN